MAHFHSHTTINLIFVAAEAFAGWKSNSTGLLSETVSRYITLVNGLTAWLLMKGQGDDINIKAAYLHAATDALVSVSVVISGIIISSRSRQ